MTAPAVAVPAVTSYSRSQLARAIARANEKAGKGRIVEKLPDATVTDLPKLPTFDKLWAAYMSTFPEGADPATYVGVKDRIWFSRFKKLGVGPTDAEKPRYDRVKAVLDAEGVIADAKRKVREANGPSQNSISNRDIAVKGMRATNKNITDGQINAALKALGLPDLSAKVAPKAKAS